MRLAPEHQLVRFRATQMFVDHATAAHSRGEFAAALASYRRARDLIAPDDDALRFRLDESVSMLSRMNRETG